ncbi:MAG: ATP-binding protein [Xenococcaceae cyanobacterium]
MTNLYQPEDVSVHNQLSLKDLVWPLEQSSKNFSLILASCNSISFRKGLVSRLKECCAIEIREIVLKPSVNTLYTSIQAALDQELPQAVMVYGLESVTALDQLLRSANQVREKFQKNFHFPLVLWVTDEVLIHLIRLAPDLYSWATTLEFLEFDKKKFDKEKLLKFYEATKPNKTLDVKNPEDEKYYVDFSKARGDQIVEDLKDSIAWADESDFTCNLFTGHIGCGKSTELLRLKKDLEEEGFHVVYFKFSEDMKMADVDIGDVLLAITLHVSQSIENLTIEEPRRLEKWLRGAAKLLLTEIEFKKFELGWPEGVGLPKGFKFGLSADNQGEFSMAIGIGKIAAKAKSDPTLRERLNQFSGSQKNKLLNELLTAINQELIEPMIAQLKQQGKKGLVVIVDNLDRPQQEYLFVDQTEFLQKLNCHIVYTMPLALMFSNNLSRLTSRFGVNPKVLPMVPIQLRDGSDYDKGMALLRQIVLARAFPDVDPQHRLNLIEEIFDSTETLDRLCRVSGGNIKNLLILINEWIRKEKKFPLSGEGLEKMIKNRFRRLKSSIDDKTRELLPQVQQRKQVSGDQEYLLIHNMFVFEYRDSEGAWFDINPILLEGLAQDEHGRIRADVGQLPVINNQEQGELNQKLVNIRDSIRKLKIVIRENPDDTRSIHRLFAQIATDYTDTQIILSRFLDGLKSI